jgi:hypothetical protein
MMSDLNPYEEGLAIDLALAENRIKELEEDNKRLRLEVLHANDTADVAINQVRILSGNVAKLIKASKPFAAIKIKDGMSQPGEIGRTDVTNIRAALAELAGGKDE